jgi:hypothetical protein
MFCHRIRSASAPRRRRPATVNRGDERRKLAAPSRCAQVRSGTCEGAALIALIALPPCMHCHHSPRRG